VTALHDGGRGFANLTPEQQTALDEATWALSEFKIDKDGVIAIKLPDKKSIIEMLAKQLGVGRDDGTNVNVGVSFEQLVQQSIQQPEQKEPA